MVPGVDRDQVTACVAPARTMLASGRTSTPLLSPAAVVMTAAPVWWPEQTAALASLETVSAAVRAPLADTVVGVVPTFADVVGAARDLLAHDPLTVGPIDNDLIGANLLALPLPLILPFAEAPRADASRFSTILTRWIAATAADDAAPDAPAWSAPPEPIGSSGDARGATGTVEDLARLAIVTTLAGAAGRRRRADPLVGRIAAALPHVWPRITGERPAGLRVDLALTFRDGDLHWIGEVPLAPLARALTGTVVPASSLSDVDPTNDTRDSETAALRLSMSLDVESPEGGRTAGHSIGPTPARLLSPDSYAACLYGLAIDGQRAILTRQDRTGSYIIDAEGHVIDAPRWPAPIIGEGPLDGDGACYAWLHDPPRLLVRDAGGAIVHDVSLPFTPTHVTTEPGNRLRFATLDGVWTWSVARGPERVLTSPPLVAAWNGTNGTLDLALFPPPGRSRARSLQQLTWSPGSGLRSQDTPPLGPCWSRSTHTGWLAEALPDADLVRLSDARGLVGWVIADYPRTVAWAGGSLVIVTAAGLVALVTNVRRAFASRPPSSTTLASPPTATRRR
jgi:hypothetical protein